MTIAVTNIGTGLYNLLYSTYGIIEVKPFQLSVNGLLPLLSKNLFKDSADIFTYGLQPLNTLFAYMGISHRGAVQELIGLLTIGSLPSATGFVFSSRGDYLYYLANDLLEVIDANNAPIAAALGLNLVPIGPTAPNDRLAMLGLCLRNLRDSSPANFSSIAYSEAITHFLDNLIAFDRARILSQKVVQAATPPAPIVPVQTVKTNGAFANFKSKGFGTSLMPMVQ